jgi:nuclear migration protein JNM1
VDLVSEVAKLQDRLAALDGGGDGVPSAEQAWRSRLAGDNVDEPAIDESHDAALRPSQPALGSAELDRRLAALEKLVGTSGEGIDTVSPYTIVTHTQTPSGSLLPSLARYEHLLSLLSQPRHLDAVSRRIKLLLVDLDRAAAASRRAGVSTGTGAGAGAGAAGDSRPSNVTLSSAEYAQLESLFTLLPRLDGLLPIVPPLLARLQSLATLHVEAADMAERLARIEGDDRDGREDVGEMMALLKAVQEGVGESRETVVRNWEAVEGRMKALEERIGRL